MRRKPRTVCQLGATSSRHIRLDSLSTAPFSSYSARTAAQRRHRAPSSLDKGHCPPRFGSSSTVAQDFESIVVVVVELLSVDSTIAEASVAFLFDTVELEDGKSEFVVDLAFCKARAKRCVCARSAGSSYANDSASRCAACTTRDITASVCNVRSRSAAMAVC